MLLYFWTAVWRPYRHVDTKSLMMRAKYDNRRVDSFLPQLQYYLLGFHRGIETKNNYWSSHIYDREIFYQKIQRNV